MRLPASGYATTCTIVRERCAASRKQVPVLSKGMTEVNSKKPARKSRIIEEMRKTVRGQHGAGLISKRRMLFCICTRCLRRRKPP